MPRTARRVALIVALASAVGVIAGARGLIARVTAFNQSSSKELYVFKPVNDREFTYAARDVVMTDFADEHGNQGVVIHYGDAELPLRATIPPGDAALPGLVRHADWLTVLRFAPRRGISFEEMERRIAAGEIRDRLVVVVREPQPGADPGTFGRAVESDWTFHIHEFLPSGGFSAEHLRYPESDRSLARRRSAARAAGRPAPERRPDELKEGTWEFAGALLAMPSGSAPGPTFAGDAMGATGWTLPVTGLSFMGLVGAGVGLAVTRERAPKDRAGPAQRD
jgi:hypothetical protein